MWLPEYLKLQLQCAVYFYGQRCCEVPTMLRADRSPGSAIHRVWSPLTRSIGITWGLVRYAIAQPLPSLMESQNQHLQVEPCHLCPNKPSRYFYSVAAAVVRHRASSTLG